MRDRISTMRIQDTANRAQQCLSVHAGMTKHSLHPPNEALIHTNNLHEPPLRLPLYCFIQPSGSNYPDAQENVTNRLTERREERGSLLGGLFVNEMYQTWQATEPGSKVWAERDGRPNLRTALTLYQTNLEQQQRPGL